MFVSYLSFSYVHAYSVIYTHSGTLVLNNGLMMDCALPMESTLEEHSKHLCVFTSMSRQQQQHDRLIQSRNIWIWMPPRITLIHQLHHLIENSNSNINNLHLLIMKGRTNQHYYKHNTTAIINILSKRSFEMAPPHIIISTTIYSFWVLIVVLPLVDYVYYSIILIIIVLVVEVEVVEVV